MNMNYKLTEDVKPNIKNIKYDKNFPYFLFIDGHCYDMISQKFVSIVTGAHQYIIKDGKWYEPEVKEFAIDGVGVSINKRLYSKVSLEEALSNEFVQLVNKSIL